MKNLQELLAALRTMHTSIFEQHVNAGKNDFASWIEDILKDTELAFELRHIKTRGETIKAIEAALRPKTKPQETEPRERESGLMGKHNLVGLGKFQISSIC